MRFLGLCLCCEIRIGVYPYFQRARNKPTGFTPSFVDWDDVHTLNTGWPTVTYERTTEQRPRWMFNPERSREDECCAFAWKANKREADQM